MGLFNQILFDIADKASPSAPDDYFNDDGIRMCGKCHTPKERLMIEMPNIDKDTIAKVFGVDRKIPHPCKCRKAQIEAENLEEERRKEAQRKERLRRDCFRSARDAACTFAVDDRTLPQVSDALQRYADGFKTMMASGDRYGLLIYGPVGTGKSFYAAAIANRLLEQGYTAAMTNFTEIVNAIMDRSVDSQQYIRNLMRKDLLIIDDLGVERDTEFVLEQITAFIDARYKSGKPLIVTTNISLEEIKKPKDLTYRRMYDRLLEMCFPIKVDGHSRRRQSVVDNYAARKETLGM